MQSTTNFRSVSLKKDVGHFSRNLWPRICKKNQKISNFWKIFFSLETTQNALKFVRNTICAVHDKFPVGISQKRRWSFFNFKFLKKFFFAWNNLKRLKIRSQHHLCSQLKISGPYLSKKKLVIFQEICDPCYAKKTKNREFSKKFFFARNNLKRLKIRSQHHLCSPLKISGPYLSKKKLVIFQEICDPGYAKKVKKFQIFEKIFFHSKQP